MITAVVVDDHPVVVAGVRAWCALADPPITVVDSGPTLATAVVGPGAEADVVVLDLQLDLSGPAYGNLKWLVDAGRRVVVSTMRDDQDNHPALMKRYGGRRIRYASLYGCGVPMTARITRQLQADLIGVAR